MATAAGIGSSGSGAAAFIDPRTIPFKGAELQNILDIHAPVSPPYELIGDPGAPDILSRLGEKMALASRLGGEEAHVINTQGEVDRSWLLGAQKLLAYEREAHWEGIVGKLMDQVVMGNTEVIARQEKMFDVMGLMAVTLSMVTTRGCIFCDDEWEARKTKELSGPSLMRHFVERHFNANNKADEGDVSDQVLMDLDMDEMPEPMKSEGFETLEHRRQAVHLVRNFLMNDLRKACQHCGEDFDFDYAWQWQPGYRSYDLTALVNSHRYYCFRMKELGETEYPAWLNRMDYQYVTTRLPKEMPAICLNSLDDVKMRMYRGFVRALAGQGQTTLNGVRTVAVGDEVDAGISKSARSGRPAGSVATRNPAKSADKTEGHMKKATKTNGKANGKGKGKGKQKADDADEESLSEPDDEGDPTYNPKKGIEEFAAERITPPLMPSDSDLDYIGEFAAADDGNSEPPLMESDEDTQPTPKWHEKRTHKPTILLPALDNALAVVEALGYGRPRHFMLSNHWSDDHLLNWLTNHPSINPNAALTLSKVPARRQLLKSDADGVLLHREDTRWVRWMFPIPDRVDDDERIEYGDGSSPLEPKYTHKTAPVQKNLPLMSAHFLMRYWADRTNTLRLHSWENLRRFWLALAFYVQRPSDDGCTWLFWHSGQGGMGWAQEEDSPVPEHISRCLRHLRMIGFEHEANLFYDALLTITEDGTVPKPSKRFREQLPIWRRIMTWQMDVYLIAVLETYVSQNFPINDLKGIIDDWALQSPFDAANTADIDQAHADFRAAQEAAGMEPFARQRPRDQWHHGIRDIHGPDSDSLYGHLPPDYCVRMRIKRGERKNRPGIKGGRKNTTTETGVRGPEGGIKDPEGDEEDLKISNQKSSNSRLVEFFCLPGTLGHGRRLEIWMALDNDALRKSAGWINWWFPARRNAITREVLGNLGGRFGLPELTRRDIETFNSRHLRTRLFQAWKRFAGGYLGLQWEMIREGEPQIFDGALNTAIPMHYQWLGGVFREDHRRLARAMRSMGDLKHYRLAQELWVAVTEVSNRASDKDKLPREAMELCRGVYDAFRAKYPALGSREGNGDDADDEDDDGDDDDDGSTANMASAVKRKISPPLMVDSARRSAKRVKFKTLPEGESPSLRYSNSDAGDEAESDEKDEEAEEGRDEDEGGEDEEDESVADESSFAGHRSPSPPVIMMGEEEGNENDNEDKSDGMALDNNEDEGTSEDSEGDGMGIEAADTIKADDDNMEMETTEAAGTEGDDMGMETMDSVDAEEMNLEVDLGKHENPETTEQPKVVVQVPQEVISEFLGEGSSHGSSYQSDVDYWGAEDAKDADTEEGEECTEVREPPQK